MSVNHALISACSEVSYLTFLVTGKGVGVRAGRTTELLGLVAGTTYASPVSASP